MLFFMPGRMAIWMYRTIGNVRWWWIFLFVIFHWHTAWLLQLWLEPQAEFSSYEVYWYFYFVTATTVGYGDYSPAVLGSRISTVLYVQLLGIVLMGVVLGKVGALFVSVADKVRKGLMQLNLSNHTVVIGDGSERTLALLRNLLADPEVADVVLLSTRTENPLNGHLAGFVSGQVSDREVQRRACLAQASRIIVLGDSDVETTGRAIAAKKANTTARIVAFLEHVDAAEDLDAITDSRVCVVTSTDMHVLVQEVLDPGAADFVKELTHNDIGADFKILQVPADVTANYTEVDTFLLERCGINVISYYVNGKVQMIPDAHKPVAGMALAVIANSREQLNGIEWSRLRRAA
jgi:voltage-gated potassium channel